MAHGSERMECWGECLDIFGTLCGLAKDFWGGELIEQVSSGETDLFAARSELGCGEYEETASPRKNKGLGEFVDLQSE